VFWEILEAHGTDKFWRLLSDWWVKEYVIPEEERASELLRETFEQEENPDVIRVAPSSTLFSVGSCVGPSSLTTTVSSSGIAIVDNLVMVTGTVDSNNVRARVDLAAGWWEIGNLRIEVEKRPGRVGRVLAELLWGVKWVEVKRRGQGA